MAPPNARGFLHKLATENTFRTRVTVRETMRLELEQHGLSFPLDKIPEHIKLPSKEEVKAAIDDLASQSVFEKPADDQKAAIVQKVWPAIPLVASVEAGDGLPG
jgi:hypothetical protein